MLPGIAVSIPRATTFINSASVIPGGDSRMLTLAIPVGVITSKAGGSASVSGEPVHPHAGIATSNGKIDKIRIVVPTQYLFSSQLGNGKRSATPTFILVLHEDITWRALQISPTFTGGANNGHATARRCIRNNEFRAMQARNRRNQCEPKTGSRSIAALFYAIETTRNRVAFVAWDAGAGVGDLDADTACVGKRANCHASAGRCGFDGVVDHHGGAAELPARTQRAATELCQVADGWDGPFE